MSTVDELEKLASLFERGFLTKAEFEDRKRHLLSMPESGPAQAAEPTPRRAGPGGTSVLRRTGGEGGLAGPCPVCGEHHDFYKEARVGASELAHTAGSLVSSFFGVARSIRSTAKYVEGVAAEQARCPSCDSNIELCPSCMTAVRWIPALTATCRGCGVTLS